MTNVDVVVIGAGPAGAAAAITLARAGREVTVIDKATFPRDKICGDGLTTSALRQLEALGVSPATVSSWHNVDTIRIRSPKGREISLRFPAGKGTYAAVATRRDLDASLVGVAAKTPGITIHQGHPVAAVTHHGTGVRVAAGGLDPLEARFVVAADGMWSPTRKLLDIATPDYRGEWHAFRQYFTDVSPRASSALIVSFEADLLPGYLWSFPLAEGRANIGFGIRRGGRYSIQDMKTLWTELLDRAHVRALIGENARPVEAHRAWPIPARVDQIRAGSGRVLFTGDAVAACDTLTGEGIGQALQTGTMAADTILRHWNAPDALAASYREALDATLVADHKMSERLGKVIAHRKGAEFPLWVAGLNEWTRRNYARWLFEDYPRALLFTPRRWRRGVTSRPGAFR